MYEPDDFGPRWLSKDSVPNFSSIEANIHAMEQFAAKLTADVQANYTPHMSTVSSSMTAKLPDPPSEFIELLTFLFAHREAQDMTHQNVYRFRDGTQNLATAATNISDEYRGSDAFAHAKVSDVEKQFGEAGTNGLPSGVEA
jgi:hypothetical protein